MRKRQYLCGLMAAVLVGCTTLPELGDEERYALTLGQNGGMCAVINFLKEEVPRKNTIIIDGWSQHYRADQKPTKKNIKRALKDLARRVDRNDIFQIIISENFWKSGIISKQELENLVNQIQPGRGVQIQMTSTRYARFVRKAEGNGWYIHPIKRRLDFRLFSPSYKAEFRRRAHLI